MIKEILIGWCTIHFLIWYSLAMLLFFGVWLAYLIVNDRKCPRPQKPKHKPKHKRPLWSRGERAAARYVLRKTAKAKGNA